MADRWRFSVGIGVTALFFALIHLGGLYVITPLVGVDPAPGTDPSDPRMSLIFVGALLVGTGFMLAAFRWGLGWIVRGIVLIVAIGLMWVVLDVLLPPLFVYAGIPLVPVGLALVIVGLLALHPEWWVLDIVGVLLGAGAVGLLGLTLGIRPVIALLVILAIYDLISVYGTKHMLTLAEGAMKGRLPVVLVVPLTLPYSLRTSDSDDDALAPDGALVIGLGDAVIPGMLATSAALYGPVEPTVVGGLALSGPILGVIVGTMIGLVALFVIPEEGKAHPGLPFLVTGAIGGYLLGSLVVGVGPIEAIAAIPFEPLFDGP